MGTVVCCRCQKMKGMSIEDQIKALSDEEDFLKAEIKEEIKNNKALQKKPTEEIKTNVTISTVLSLLSELEYHLRDTFIYVEEGLRASLEDEYMKKMQDVWDIYYTAKSKDFPEEYVTELDAKIRKEFQLDSIRKKKSRRF